MSKSTDAKLYKRTRTKNGTEYTSWVARQHLNGRMVEASAPTQIDALQRLAKKITDIESGAIGISAKMTVRRWAYEWLKTYKKDSVGEKQYKLYKSHIDNLILPEIGALQIKEIKPVQLQKILNTRKGYSADNTKTVRNTIRGIFYRAYVEGLILRDPSIALEVPETTSGTHRSITTHEREHILRVAAEHKAGLYVKMILYCGLRPGEARALQWRHVDLPSRRITVERAIESGTEREKGTKTESGVRRIPIPAAYYDDLVAAQGEPFAPVFAQETTGRRHTETSIRCLWRSFKNALDISMGAKFEKRKAKDGKKRMTKVLSVVADDLVPYCLRHTYGTDLQDAGVPINVAKYLMGHSDISVTANIYTHTTDEIIRDAADLIDAKPDIICGENRGEKTAT